jgi:hypothetical protein
MHQNNSYPALRDLLVHSSVDPMKVSVHPTEDHPNSGHRHAISMRWTITTSRRSILLFRFILSRPLRIQRSQGGRKRLHSTHSIPRKDIIKSDKGMSGTYSFFY